MKRNKYNNTLKSSKHEWTKHVGRNGKQASNSIYVLAILLAITPIWIICIWIICGEYLSCWIRLSDLYFKIKIIQ